MGSQVRQFAGVSELIGCTGLVLVCVCEALLSLVWFHLTAPLLRAFVDVQLILGLVQPQLIIVRLLVLLMIVRPVCMLDRYSTRYDARGHSWHGDVGSHEGLSLIIAIVLSVKTGLCLRMFLPVGNLLQLVFQSHWWCVLSQGAAAVLKHVMSSGYLIS